ncbi:MAG: hypothetical protein WBA74_07970, partial [Cyclobacteriaceae bacterium]
KDDVAYHVTNGQFDVKLPYEVNEEFYTISFFFYINKKTNQNIITFGSNQITTENLKIKKWYHLLIQNYEDNIQIKITSDDTRLLYKSKTSFENISFGSSYVYIQHIVMTNYLIEDSIIDRIQSVLPYNDHIIAQKCRDTLRKDSFLNNIYNDTQFLEIYKNTVINNIEKHYNEIYISDINHSKHNRDDDNLEIRDPRKNLQMLKNIKYQNCFVDVMFSDIKKWYDQNIFYIEHSNSEIRDDYWRKRRSRVDIWQPLKRWMIFLCTVISSENGKEKCKRYPSKWFVEYSVYLSKYLLPRLFDISGYGNHGVIKMYGLFFYGIIYPFHKNSENLEQVLTEKFFHKNIHGNILPDGSSYEVTYHYQEIYTNYIEKTITHLEKENKNSYYKQFLPDLQNSLISKTRFYASSFIPWIIGFPLVGHGYNNDIRTYIEDKKFNYNDELISKILLIVDLFFRYKFADNERSKKYLKKKYENLIKPSFNSICFPYTNQMFFRNGWNLNDTQIFFRGSDAIDKVEMEFLNVQMNSKGYPVFGRCYPNSRNPYSSCTSGIDFQGSWRY